MKAKALALIVLVVLAHTLVEGRSIHSKLLNSNIKIQSIAKSPSTLSSSVLESENQLHSEPAASSHEATSTHLVSDAHGASAGGHGHGTASIGAIIAVVASLVILSLIIEISTEHLEHILRKKHVEEMLLKIYKELMILGVCSLFLFIEEKFDLMAKFSHESFDKHLFEHIHMMLFAVVVVYIVIVIYIMIYTIILANTFKKMEEVSSRQAQEIHASYKIMKNEQKSMGTLVSYLKFWWRWRYENIRFHHQFLKVKALFTEQHAHEFPQVAEGHFHLYVYMRKCIRTVCLQLAGIHWQVWMFVLFIVFLESLNFETGQLGSGAYQVMFANCVVLWCLVLYMLHIWKKSIKATDRIYQDYDEFCITHRQATLLAEKEKRKKKGIDDDEDENDEEDDLLTQRNKSKKQAKKKGGSQKGKHDETHDEEEEEEESEAEDSEEEGYGDTKEFHSGASFFGVATPHQKLFPFNSPSVVLRSIQFCVLLLAILIPMYGFELWDSVVHAPAGFQWFIHISMLLTFIILCFIIVPNTLPRFVLATSVASMSRVRLLKETIDKYEREQKKVAREARRAKLAVHGHDDEEH